MGIFAPMELPSRKLTLAVEQIASLPGIGKKSALRLALHLLRRDEERVEAFARAILEMRTEVKPCSVCNSLSEGDTCATCADPLRDERLICVVEDLRDLLAIEAIGSFRGRFHVLGGLISPMDGVGPGDLAIDGLVRRAQGLTAIDAELPPEIIFALPTTMEGETTAFYLFKKLQPTGVRVTTIARGVAVGDDLQHADEATLDASIRRRLPYNESGN
jgi:recombination protein RecR